MLFHTWEFLAFFAIVYTVFIVLTRCKTRYWLHWLLLCSYFFYGRWRPDPDAAWTPLYLLLIFYSTLLDYAVVVLMEKSRRRWIWLTVSLVNNLGILCFFKYAGFILGNVNGLLAAGNLSLQLPVPDVVLPVGISFFTFQSMSYTIDYYRGQIERERSFVRFAAFVSLFPQLVAGPIERASELLPQLHRTPKPTVEDFTAGLSLFVVGLFKKLALANYLAMYVEPIYRVPGQYNSLALMLATFAFAWQIYFDFSGYTDMARGIARMLGLRLMLNFNHPYLATSLGDFWCRWHISLSTWFRDYVYVPLGGNRRGAWITYRNLLLTFVISGMWHGAAWTFIIWGAIHAFATLATRRAERSDWYRTRIPMFVKQLGVFLIVCFAWIFFRAESLEDALIIVSRIFTTSWTDPQFPLLAAVMVGSVWAYEFVCESGGRRFLEHKVIRVAMVSLMIIYLLTIPGGDEKAFIYFQF